MTCKGSSSEFAGSDIKRNADPSTWNVSVSERLSLEEKPYSNYNCIFKPAASTTTECG
jgi:hypothetical protein